MDSKKMGVVGGKVFYVNTDKSLFLKDSSSGQEQKVANGVLQVISNGTLLRYWTAERSVALLSMGKRKEVKTGCRPIHSRVQVVTLPDGIAYCAYRGDEESLVVKEGKKPGEIKCSMGARCLTVWGGKLCWLSNDGKNSRLFWKGENGLKNCKLGAYITTLTSFGGYLLGASGTSVHVWKDQKHFKTFNAGGCIRSLCVQNSRLFIGRRDGLEVWNLNEWKHKHTYDVKGQVFFAHLFSNGNLVAGVGEEVKAHLKWWSTHNDDQMTKF